VHAWPHHFFPKGDEHLSTAGGQAGLAAGNAGTERVHDCPKTPPTTPTNPKDLEPRKPASRNGFGSGPSSPDPSSGRKIPCRRTSSRASSGHRPSSLGLDKPASGLGPASP
jgi:hypothetical protein